MISVSLVKVPSIHWLTPYWSHEFCSSDERGLMLRPRELLKHTSVREPVVWSSTHKGQVRIGSGVPGPRGGIGCILWTVEQHYVIICCPLNQTLSVGCNGSVSPLYIRAIEITTMHAWGWEHRKGRFKGARIEVCSRTTIQSQNLWEIDWLVSRTGSHSQVWLDRASCLGLTQPVQSLELLAYQPAPVQWVSWRGMTRALVLWARHSTMPILVAVVPSMFSWNTAGCRHFAKRPEKGVFLYSSEVC